MKNLAPLTVPLIAIASLWAYLSGMARLLITYAPTVKPEAIFSAQQQAFPYILFGTVGIALSAGVAGVLYARHRAISTASFAILAIVLGGSLALYITA